MARFFVRRFTRQTTLEDFASPGGSSVPAFEYAAVDPGARWEGVESDSARQAQQAARARLMPLSVDQVAERKFGHAHRCFSAVSSLWKLTLAKMATLAETGMPSARKF
jgi:hypothetical protein